MSSEQPLSEEKFPLISTEDIRMCSNQYQHAQTMYTEIKAHQLNNSISYKF